MMKKETRTTKRNGQAGFTLIEIAIVLVIIGLLIGGVLKGQELIANAKVKQAANDLNGISAAYYSYMDRYKRQPGDDGPIATLQARGGSWTGVRLASTPNGVIASTAAQTFTGAGENSAFFVHMRAAGLLTGDHTAAATVAALPINSFGGLTGFTNVGVTGMATSNKICMSQVPGKAAAALDQQLDDGRSNSGQFQATLGAVGVHTAPGAAVATYSETNVYTVCRSF